MKEEDKSKLVEVFNGIALGSRTCKKFAGKQWHRINLERRMVVNIVLPETAVDVAVLVNEANYEAAMEVVRSYEKKEDGD